jgi:transposase
VELKRLARKQRAEHTRVQRARIVLLAARGLATPAIAQKVGCSERGVRKWKARFRDDPRVEALEDRPRPGCPAQVPVAVRCALVQLACERPDGVTIPFRQKWTYGALAEALRLRTGYELSVSEVGRILRYVELRPHRVRQWLKSSDPEFRAKAERLCDLYLSPPKDAVVVCMDEKPMQVLERVQPTHVGPDGTVRYEYEYKRHGTRVLLAAYDIRTGQVFGRVLPERTAEATVQFMDELAEHYKGRTVYVVWDNLNTHYDGPSARWTHFNKRHGGRFHFVFTPKHASWMNQVEIWFSILHRRVLQYGSFDTPARLAREVEAFIRYWNQHEARPFRWTWRYQPRQTPHRQAA